MPHEAGNTPSTAVTSTTALARPAQQGRRSPGQRDTVESPRCAEHSQPCGSASAQQGCRRAQRDIDNLVHGQLGNHNGNQKSMDHKISLCSTKGMSKTLKMNSNCGESAAATWSTSGSEVDFHEHQTTESEGALLVNKKRIHHRRTLPVNLVH